MELDGEESLDEDELADLELELDDDELLDDDDDEPEIDLPSDEDDEEIDEDELAELELELDDDDLADVELEDAAQEKTLKAAQADDLDDLDLEDFDEADLEDLDSAELEDDDTELEDLEDDGELGEEIDSDELEDIDLADIDSDELEGIDLAEVDEDEPVAPADASKEPAVAKDNKTDPKKGSAAAAQDELLELDDDDLKDIELDDDIDLEDADLEDVDLEDVDLEDVDLEDVDLEDADLEDVDLEDADLEDVDLAEDGLGNDGVEDEALDEDKDEALEPEVSDNLGNDELEVDDLEEIDDDLDSEALPVVEVSLTPSTEATAVEASSAGLSVEDQIDDEELADEELDLDDTDLDPDLDSAEGIPPSDDSALELDDEELILDDEELILDDEELESEALKPRSLDDEVPQEHASPDLEDTEPTEGQASVDEIADQGKPVAQEAISVDSAEDSVLESPVSVDGQSLTEGLAPSMDSDADLKLEDEPLEDGDLEDELDLEDGELEDELDLEDGELEDELDLEDGELEDELDLEDGELADELDLEDGELADELDLEDEELESIDLDNEGLDHLEDELADDDDELLADVALDVQDSEEHGSVEAPATSDQSDAAALSSETLLEGVAPEPAEDDLLAGAAPQPETDELLAGAAPLGELMGEGLGSELLGAPLLEGDPNELFSGPAPVNTVGDDFFSGAATSEPETTVEPHDDEDDGFIADLEPHLDEAEEDERLEPPTKEYRSSILEALRQVQKSDDAATTRADVLSVLEAAVPKEYRAAVSERRRLVRLSCEYDVNCFQGNQIFHATIRDISLGGMKIEVTRQLESGSELQVSNPNRTQDEPDERITAQVRWYRVKDSGKAEVGLQFVDPPEVLGRSWVVSLLNKVGMQSQVFNQRKYTRAAADFDIDIIDESGDIYPGRCVDLGLGGALVDTVPVFEQNDVLTFRCHSFGMHGLLQCESRVVKIKHMEESFGRYALEFESLDAPTTKLLGRYVVDLLKLGRGPRSS